MYVMRISLFPLLLLSSVIRVEAQNPPAVRDASAVTAVQNAITALGGTAALNAISDSTAQGTFLVDPSNPSNTGTFTWQTGGSEFNYTTVSSAMTRTFVSGHGTPGDLQNGVSCPTGPHVVRATLPYHIPGLALLGELNNSNYSMTYVGPETQNGIAVIHVQTADNSDSIGSTVTPQDWYFDASSYLPVSVQYRVPDSVDATVYSALSKNFGTFNQVDSVLVPSSFVNTMNGTSRTITVTSLVFNSGLSPSTFDLP